MRIRVIIKILIGMMALIAGLTGCTNSKIYEKSRALQLNENDAYSTVYFLRPEVKRGITGVVDNSIRVEINGEETVALSQGEYVMVRVVPSEAVVTFKSLSMVGSKIEPQEMRGSQTFNFAAEQTNFILVKAINEEFRGAYFMPERIEFNEARKIARDLTPAGAARKRPIEKL